MPDQSKYIKNGIRQAIYCETYGLLTALFIFALFDGLRLVFEFPRQIVFGIGCLYVWAFLSGGIAGKLVYRSGLKSLTIWLIGVLLAWSNVLALGLAANSTAFFGELEANNFGGKFPYYIFMLTAWSIVVGFIPALILGFLWTRQMRKTLAADDY